MYIEAENSFLSKFCKIDQYVWGSHYLWLEGANWPKFNFIRITNNHLTSKEDIESIHKLNQINKIPTYIKVDIRSDFDVSVFSIDKKVQFGGIPIAFLKTSSNCFKSIQENKSVEITKVEVKENLLDWWLVNSSGRSRENALKSPLYQILLTNFSSSCFYLLRNNNETIGCFAVDQIGNNSINLWGVAISKNFQGKGNLKNIYKFLYNEYENIDVYGQVNIDSVTFMYRNKFLSTKTYLIEKRYEIF